MISYLRTQTSNQYEQPSRKDKRHLKVSLFAGEPVSRIIDNVGEDMLVFTSDYTNQKGKGDPVSKFERTISNCNQATMDKFYFDNILEIVVLS